MVCRCSMPRICASCGPFAERSMPCVPGKPVLDAIPSRHPDACEMPSPCFSHRPHCSFSTSCSALGSRAKVRRLCHWLCSRGFRSVSRTSGSPSRTVGSPSRSPSPGPIATHARTGLWPVSTFGVINATMVGSAVPLASY